MLSLTSKHSTFRAISSSVTEDIFFQAIKRASLCTSHGQQALRPIRRTNLRNRFVKTSDPGLKKILHANGNPTVLSPRRFDRSLKTGVVRTASIAPPRSTAVVESKPQICLEKHLRPKTKLQLRVEQGRTRSERDSVPTAAQLQLLPEGKIEKSDPSQHKIKWPDRLRGFVSSMPIRNYMYDFDLWDMSAEEIWRRFSCLPQPRCTAISRTALRYVLDSIARERPRTTRGMQRYIAIIDEMKSQPIPIVPSVSEWTAAISFVGRAHKNPLIADVERCLALWDEMENRFGVKAERITFNVLLDVTIKARNWHAASSIAFEMDARGISPDRFTWTTMIQKAGYRKDGDAVRKTARLMIEAGEVVDVYVINTIMGALIRAGEAEEAEHLFEKIKQMTIDAQSQQDTAEPRKRITRQATSDLTSQYIRQARENRRDRRSDRTLDDEHIPLSVDSQTPRSLSPDIASFSLLLQYHCVTTGNFSRVTAILEDMERFDIEDSVSMFKSLFFGFAVHGKRDPAWNLKRLDHIFDALLRTSEIKLTQDLSRLAIRAYGVLGNEKLVTRAWNELDAAWQKQGGDPSKRSTNLLQEVTIARALSKSDLAP